MKLFLPSSDITKSIYELTHSRAYKLVYTLHPVDLAKTFLFTYLTASTPLEFLNSPIKTYIDEINGYEVVRLTKLQAWAKRPLEQFIPIDNVAEKNAWEYVADGILYSDAQKRPEIRVEFLNYFQPYEKQRTHISNLFTKNFKVDLKDDSGHVHKSHGISPRLLRSLRAENLSQKGYPLGFISSFFGRMSSLPTHQNLDFLKPLSPEERHSLKLGRNVFLQ